MPLFLADQPAFRATPPHHLLHAATKDALVLMPPQSWRTATQRCRAPATLPKLRTLPVRVAAAMGFPPCSEDVDDHGLTLTQKLMPSLAVGTRHLHDLEMAAPTLSTTYTTTCRSRALLPELVAYKSNALGENQAWTLQRPPWAYLRHFSVWCPTMNHTIQKVTKYR
uniref:Retrotransposon protein, putative, Ty3-gypsy subclass n=2 Tax=Oryza sativa subsp. japonica TaxID=39947 RepID=Q75M82_ORYSJ|nr:hypothetical protein [Oryza sativa Japonica Group]ABF96283.1 retrotransposon protein, putative, Ty3-gypsy subclass [Oryza sativa Japonica Group]